MRVSSTVGVTLAIVIALVEGKSHACQPCAARAQEMRAAAAADRQTAARLGGGGGSNAGGPSMASSYLQGADVKMKIAASLDAAYQQCMSGVKNACGQGSGGGGGGAGASGGAAGSPVERASEALRSLQGQAGAQVQQRLAALREINDALSRMVQEGNGDANQAARSIGQVSLDEAGADTPRAAPAPGQFDLTPSQLETLRNAPTRMPTDSTFNPGTPVVVPYDGPPVTEIDFTKKDMNTLIPAGAPPPATPEELVKDMDQAANAPASPPPTQVLGVPVTQGAPGDGSAPPPEGSAANNNGYSKFDEAKIDQDLEAMAKRGILSALKDKPDLAGAVNTVKEQLEPMQQVYEGLANDSGASMVANAKTLTTGARKEVREDLTNVTRLAGGESDRIVRNLHGRGEEYVTKEEEFANNVEGGDPDLLKAHLPRPIVKALELRDEANEKLKSASETASFIIDRAGVYYRAAKATRGYVRGQVRDAASEVVDYVQQLWGAGQ